MRGLCFARLQERTHSEMNFGWSPGSGGQLDKFSVGNISCSLLSSAARMGPSSVALLPPSQLSIESSMAKWLTDL
jgi:hypothetical protein